MTELNNLDRTGFFTSIKTRSKYAKLNRNKIRLNAVPNAEECTKFWGDICGVRKEYNREAERLKDLKRERERVNLERPEESVSIIIEKVMKQCRRIPHWKAPGRDGVQGQELQ